ncbi:hypothetical protein ABW636_02420 [Aquimarina sp. 2201CG1-2-11]|uniref:hypothetical protein n=1 Tax=Aquimarina discodermiae TaxID=3231043 RepID=UPI003462A549
MKKIIFLALLVVILSCNLQEKIVEAMNSEDVVMNSKISNIDGNVSTIKSDVNSLSEKGVNAEPYAQNPNSLGYHLESSFKALKNRCNLSYNKEDVYSFIPNNIRESESIDEDLSKNYNHIARVGSQNLFNGIYEEPVFSDEILYNPDLNLRIFRENWPLGVSLQDGHINKVEHIQTCTGMALAAINAKFNIPPGEIDASLRAETDSSTELLLLGGSFFSPLHSMLTSTNESIKNWVRLKLWQNYEMNSQFLEMENSYYVKGFYGYMSFLGTRDKFEFSSSLDANLAADVSVIEVSGNVSGAISKKSSTEIKEYNIYVQKGISSNNEYISWGKMPTPELIRDEMAEVNPIVKGDNNWIKYDDYFHEVTIWGVPSEMSNKNNWSVQETNGSSTNPDIVNVKEINDPSKLFEGSLFLIKFNPPKSFFDETIQDKPYDLSYKISYNDKILVNNQEVILSFEVNDNKIYRKKDLSIESLSEAYTFSPQTISDNINKIEWDIQIPFSDDNNRVDKDRNVKVLIKNGILKFERTNITGFIQNNLIHFEIGHNINHENLKEGIQTFPITVSIQLPINSSGYTETIEKTIELYTPIY